MATKAIRVRRVYVRRSRSRAKSGFTLPLAVLGGCVPLVMGEVGAVKRAMNGDIEGAKQQAVIYATGYNLDTRSFHWPTFAMSYGPIVAGALVHKLANRLGVNRAIAKSGIPFIRI